MAEAVHPFYAAHRGAMEDAMRQRLDRAEPMLRGRAGLSDVGAFRRDAMAEFEVVLAQMPDVGGAANRMSDFFMRLLGFIAVGRALRRRGVPAAAIGDVLREVHRAEAYAAPETERLEAGRAYLSAENRARLRAQAERSRARAFPGDFVYDLVEPGPGEDFAFGIDYSACGFCAFAARHGDGDLLPHLCGLDADAYAARGIRMERTRTLAGGADRCDFRFSRLASPDDGLTSPTAPPAP